MSHHLADDVHQKWNRLLARYQVDLTEPRPRMLKLMSLPIGKDFNKPATNVLLSQSARNGIWHAFVDDDLKYRGEDVQRRQMLHATADRGWRQLNFPAPVHGDVNHALGEVLRWLDSPVAEEDEGSWDENELAPGGPKELGLSGMLMDSCRELAIEELGGPDRVLTGSQQRAVKLLEETFLRAAEPACGVVLGKSGVGKTTVVRQAAGNLLRADLVNHVVEIQAAQLAAGAIFMPDRDDRLRKILSRLESFPHTLVIVEQLDLLIAHSDVAVALMAHHIEHHGGWFATVRPEFRWGHLTSASQLRRRLDPIVLQPATTAETHQLLVKRLSEHPHRDRVDVAPEALPLIAARCRRRCANPAAALAALDVLISRARLADRQCVGPDDVLHYLSDRGDRRSGRSSS